MLILTVNTQIFKIIGKGAEGVNNRVGIPARLVFDALAFHRALAQRVVDVYGQLSGMEQLRLMQ